MLARASLAALFGFLLLGGFSGAAQAEVGTLQGKLWLVSNAGGLAAKLPVPVAPPDATFVTRHVAFDMSAPVIGGSENNVDNTVESFLASAHPDAVPSVMDLAFSGQYNSVVGAVVDSSTPTVNSTAAGYGTYGVAYCVVPGSSMFSGGPIVAS